MMNCIFCRIIAGEIPTSFKYQDEEVVAFADINPQAPVHLLIVPRNHIPSVAELANPAVVARLVAVATKIAGDESILESGFRLVINSGKDGGQVVPHLHMHLLGGRRLPERIR